MKKEEAEAAAVATEKGQEKQQIYAEIPGILAEKVGTVDMFDVQVFLDSAKTEKTVAQYMEERAEVIAVYERVTGIQSKHLVMKLEGEPTMMHTILALDFAGWVIPDFHVYLLERSNEMLINGFTCSDRYVAAASQRLPKKDEAPQQ